MASRTSPEVHETVANPREFQILLKSIELDDNRSYVAREVLPFFCFPVFLSSLGIRGTCPGNFAAQIDRAW